MADPFDGSDVPGEPTGLPEPEVGPVVSPQHGRRDNPDRLTYGSSGVGSSYHLWAAQFMRMAGIRMLHVPFRGGPPAIAEIVAHRPSPKVMPSANATKLTSMLCVKSQPENAAATSAEALPPVDSSRPTRSPGVCAWCDSGISAPLEWGSR